VSTYYTTCAKCGDEIGSAHKILWLAARPFHPECATERDRTGEREAAVAELLEAAKRSDEWFDWFYNVTKQGVKNPESRVTWNELKQAIANYVRLRDE